MAVKYHINDSGSVERCRAFIRACPFQDYTSEESARSAMYLKEEKSLKEETRSRLNALLNERNSPEYYVRLRLKSDHPEALHPRSPLAFAEKVHAITKQDKDPSVILVDAEIDDHVFNPKKIRMSMSRSPQADYARGKIVSNWEVTIKTPKETKKLNLDFSNNYRGSMKELREEIDKVSIVYQDFTSEGYDNDATDRILDKMKKVHSITEEEAMGPYHSNDFFRSKGVKIDGTFSNSEDAKVDIDENINETTLRPASFARYIDTNPYFRHSKPKVNMRVLDNENGMSNSWWGITYSNDLGWGIQSRTYDGEDTYKKFDNPEELEEYVDNFVRNYMYTDSDAVAKSRAKYAGNLMRGMSRVLDIHSEEHERKVADTEKRIAAMERKSESNSLFGRTKEKSTANTILDMFS